MNIMFFLTPKADVAFLHDTDTLRQAMEKMENHRYSSIPLIGESDGRYLGTITEGDILWYLKDRQGFWLQDMEQVSIMTVPRSRDNQPVDASSRMEDLMDKATIQNFVPVTDDKGSFIGIVTRKDILQYLKSKVDTACDCDDLK